MKNNTFCLIAVFLLVCCEQKPTIDYASRIDTTAVMDESVKDTTKILVSELPIKFDSTNILIFAISLVDLEERGGYRKTEWDSYSSSEIASIYFDRDKFSGNFINLVFHDTNGNERKLTDRKVSIQKVTFLSEIFSKTKNGYLLYSVFDRDTNGDKKIDPSDLEALYISKIDGTEFKKILAALHKFYDYNLIKGENSLYFRTLEDSNKDGKLNNQDTFHYYHIDFSESKYEVTEYNPVKIFE